MSLDDAGAMAALGSVGSTRFSVLQAGRKASPSVVIRVPIGGSLILIAPDDALSGEMQSRLAWEKGVVLFNGCARNPQPLNIFWSL